jgi:hypothetical protein
MGRLFYAIFRGEHGNGTEKGRHGCGWHRQVSHKNSLLNSGEKKGHRATMSGRYQDGRRFPCRKAEEKINED